MNTDIKRKAIMRKASGLQTTASGQPEITETVDRDDLGFETTASGDTSRGPTQQGATPAPWFWNGDKGLEARSETVLCGDCGRKECGRTRLFVSEANRRLIAQSPALLAALKEAIEIIHIFHGEAAWEIYFNSSPDMKRLRAVILAAEAINETPPKVEASNPSYSSRSSAPLSSANSGQIAAKGKVETLGASTLHSAQIAINAEICWCSGQRNDADAPPQSYMDGFVNGLKQALLIIGRIAKDVA